MSWQAVDAVLKYSQSKGSARLLLLCIAHHAQPDGTGARVAIPTLEDETKIDRRHVNRLLKVLGDSGELQWQSGGGRVSSTYDILLPVPRQGSHDAPTSTDSTSHDTRTSAAMTPRPSVQTTTVVNDVAVSLNKQTPTIEQLNEALQNEGITPDVAKDLVKKYAARIPRQLEYLDYRAADDRAAILVASIKENWGAPANYAKQRREAAQAQEDREATERAAKAKEEAKKAQQETNARSEREAAELDAKYLALTKAQQAKVKQEAINRLGVVARRGKGQKGALDAMIRNIMRERAGGAQ